MFVRVFLPAAAMLMLASAGAMAAQMTARERCDALEKQFDQAIVSHANAPKAADGRALRVQGGQLCAASKHADGIAKLRAAFADIGVTPTVQ